jgi:hypothetical protein
MDENNKLGNALRHTGIRAYGKVHLVMLEDDLATLVMPERALPLSGIQHARFI